MKKVTSRFPCYKQITCPHYKSIDGSFLRPGINSISFTNPNKPIVPPSSAQLIRTKGSQRLCGKQGAGTFQSFPWKLNLQYGVFWDACLNQNCLRQHAVSSSESNGPAASRIPQLLMLSDG